MAKTKGPTPDQWGDLITQAELYQQKAGNSKAWGEYRDFYRGDFPEWVTGMASLPLNITFAQARSAIPKVYFRNPYINVSPRVIGTQANDPIADIRARMVEGVDNMLVQEMGLKRTMKSGALSCFLCGKAVWKVGFDSQYGYNPSDSFIEFGATQGEEEEDVSQRNKKGDRIEYDSRVKSNMPWVRLIDLDQFLVPYGSKEMEDMAWADHIIVRPTQDLADDTKYTGVKGMSGTHLDRLLRNSNKGALLTEMERHLDLTEIHEIRDRKRERLIAIVTKDGNQVVRDVHDPFQIEGLPFVAMHWNEDPEYFWCPSDAKIIEPQQLEINEVNTQAMLHRKIALLKILYDNNILDLDDINNLESSEVGIAVGIDGPVDESKIRILQPHIPPDLVIWKNQVLSDVRLLLGQAKQEQGEEGSVRKSSFESQAIHAGSEIRMDEKRDAMADALGEIMRKVNQMIFKFWSVDRVAQVVGIDGARYWVNYNKESIRGEYNLKVDVESMTPHTKALKRKELIQLIQALAQNPRANIDYLLRQLMREFDWLDVMKVLPEGNPNVMSANEFTGQQQGMMNNPAKLKASAGNTANALQNMVRGG